MADEHDTVTPNAPKTLSYSDLLVISDLKTIVNSDMI